MVARATGADYEFHHHAPEFEKAGGSAAKVAALDNPDAAATSPLFDALEQNELDPEFQRLLLHSALEDHELAQMFWEKFVHRVYKFLGAYIRERQRDGAMVKVEPAIVVRAFIGMVIHHSLNNNLWDRKRRLLKISNQAAARHFTEILLRGVTSNAKSPHRRLKAGSNSRRKQSGK